MLTQCPQCETLFRLGAGDLRRAKGQVRCGECSHVFNALDYLQEEEAAVQSVQPPWLTDSAKNAPGELAPELDESSEPEAEADDSWSTPGADTASDVELTDGWDDEEDDDESGHGILVLEGDNEAKLADEPDEANDTLGAPVSNDARDPDPADWLRESEHFDPAIWERIPGVGALTDAPLSAADWQPESAPTEKGVSNRPPDSEPPDAPEVFAADDAASLDALEFDVPADKWSNFFGPVSRAGATAVWRPPDLEAEPVPLQDDDDPLITLDSTTDHSTDADEPHFDLAADAYEAEDFSDEPRLDSGNGERLIAAADEARVAVEDEDDNESESAEDTEPFPDDEPDYKSDDDESFAYVPDNEDPEAGDSPELLATPPWRPGVIAGSHEPPGQRRTGLLTLGALLATLALVGQLVHYNRDRLAAHPGYGEQVREVYELLPTDIYPLWSLTEYEVRSAEAVVGESGADILDIRAQVAVTGATPAGLPLLRVVLRDRWSNPVAARDFRPAEYAGDGTLPDDGLLQPGQPITAHLRIIDPGAGAQGFELELCLPRRHTGLECNNQIFR